MYNPLAACHRRYTQLVLHPEVQAALDAGQPVVALESTLITHGLPRPKNLEVARAMEATIRDAGAVPATIAILGGQITVGLTDEQLAYLASADQVRKCSRRDLPIAAGRGEDGATTVAGTMRVAHMAGIRVFATGGIGGVHRGHPFDVSADLLELGRTPVTVVCAGAKAILDLPLTLEVLETQGVPLIGYGVDEFPAFYSRSSGLPVDVRCDTPAEVAAIIQARDALGLPGGVLVAVPVPAGDELPSRQAEDAIARALADAEAQGITGKAVTPFLLARVSELTGQASLRANTALLLNNARVASAIAIALSI
ncbi:MAG: pseudouridine-5'-phosphate glycosidase [Anaerolineae bacterium]